MFNFEIFSRSFLSASTISSLKSLWAMLYVFISASCTLICLMRVHFKDLCDHLLPRDIPGVLPRVIQHQQHPRPRQFGGAASLKSDHVRPKRL
ncbi:hypothetical protein K402DRAFT_147674 [Aulographum hederae CBS 113979]|uniref:Uncharacterized protein n=1 Tax=Aulographum hederae CBS 113979 TaxID=1176131 RepID=A0A6G1GTJ3_9PEZI|nr:hypothetical protein K402DRAFT_147674 [Aulographum hederae CBS 113979]